jgi:hypothetical protein
MIIICIVDVLLLLRLGRGRQQTAPVATINFFCNYLLLVPYYDWRKVWLVGKYVACLDGGLGIKSPHQNEWNFSYENIVKHDK